jgi:hypothetical protein
MLKQFQRHCGLSNVPHHLESRASYDAHSWDPRCQKLNGNFMGQRQIDMSRRGMIRAALAGIAAGSIGGSRAGASDKMTRQQAEYQDTPKGIYSCATCSLFEPPKSCKVVEGDVSPDGWCRAFALAD